MWTGWSLGLFEVSNSLIPDCKNRLKTEAISTVCDCIVYLGSLQTRGCCLGFTRMDQNDSMVWQIGTVSLSTIFIFSELYWERFVWQLTSHLKWYTALCSQNCCFWLDSSDLYWISTKWGDGKISSCLNQFYKLKDRWEFSCGSRFSCSCRIVGGNWWLSDLFQAAGIDICPLPSILLPLFPSLVNRILIFQLATPVLHS